MKRFFCDNCGREISENQTNNFNKKWKKNANSEATKRFDKLDTFIKMLGYIDLCDWCHNCMLLEVSNMFKEK